MRKIAFSVPSCDTCDCCYCFSFLFLQVSSPRTEQAVKAILNLDQEKPAAETNRASLSQEGLKKRTLKRPVQPVQEPTSSQPTASQTMHKLPLHGKGLKGQEMVRGEMKVGVNTGV